jgi:hypothetical protein
MKLDKLNTIIREEVTKSLLLNEIYDLDRVKYSPSIEKQVDGLVNVLQKSSNLSKIQVASILNDIIMALGLNRTQMTMYMNMIKQQRHRAQF